MSAIRWAAALFAVAAAVWGLEAEAKKTVCTITVNSADEKETLRARLPRGEYEFVELVEKGRPDWLRSSCQKGVQCDVLIVSGHFNAGDTFYSDRLENDEYLEVDELERASCSASCPNLFSRLKEVYLFGCESLNPDATKYASSYGESGRDRMRRLFPNVPSIYGFYSSAPVGPTAGMLLNRYFDQGGTRALGTGDVNAKLLKVFGRNHMTRVSGVRNGEPMAAHRRQVCQFFDERKSAAQKLDFAHGLLKGEGGDPRAFFKRIDRMVAALDERERGSADFSGALARLSADDATRGRFLAMARSTPPSQERARMIALAATFGWLDEAAVAAEQVAMVNELLARPALGFADVDLVCALNADRHLDGELSGVKAPAARKAPHSAALACLGSAEAHQQVLRALASASDADVQVAQAYLRHRPIDSAELRHVARDVTRMQGPAQVRALDALARLNISDRAILEDLSRAFADTKSAQVQRALAEVFIRSDPKALPRRQLADIVREHRIKSPGAAPDLVDTLLARLQG